MEQKYEARAVDELGRIVLPYKLREALGIKQKDKLEISTIDGNILLKPIKQDK